MVSVLFHHLSRWKATWINNLVFICENNETTSLLSFLILLQCWSKFKKKTNPNLFSFLLLRQKCSTRFGGSGWIWHTGEYRVRTWEQHCEMQRKTQEKVVVGRGRGGNYNQAKSTLILPRGLQTARFRLPKSAVLTDQWIWSLIGSVCALWRVESV